MHGQGHLLLAGGAEFAGMMRQADQRALELMGERTGPVCILPTAAAPDHNDQRAGRNGASWWSRLGADHPIVVPVIDKASANDRQHARTLQEARLIYLLGGFPAYLERTLRESQCWRAILEAYEHGAVLAGSSAGAMVLCQYYFDPTQQSINHGFNLLPGTCLLPHHNTFGQGWVQQLTEKLPDIVLIGIDEGTGMIDEQGELPGSAWSVYGQGSVSIYRRGKATTYKAGQHFSEHFAVEIRQNTEE